MAGQTLLPDPSSLHLLHVEAQGNVITMAVRTTASEARCSLCGSFSTKVHSRYTRLLADLPWMGHAVRLKLSLRRFFCLNPECQRKIFAERLPHVVAPYCIIKRPVREWKDEFHKSIQSKNKRVGPTAWR